LVERLVTQQLLILDLVVCWSQNQNFGLAC